MLFILRILRVIGLVVTWIWCCVLIHTTSAPTTTLSSTATDGRSLNIGGGNQGCWSTRVGEALPGCFLVHIIFKNLLEFRCLAPRNKFLSNMLIMESQNTELHKDFFRWCNVQICINDLGIESLDFFYRCHCQGSAREGYRFMSLACHCPHQRDQDQLSPVMPQLYPPWCSRAPGGNVMSCLWWSSSNQGIGIWFA